MRALFYLILLSCVGAVASAAEPGEQLYAQHCAACHSVALDRAPHISSLEAMNRAAFLFALDDGAMREQSSRLSVDDKSAIADFIVGDSTAPAWAWRSMRCEESISIQSARNVHWGFDLSNARHVAESVAGEPALQWAFAYPGATRARSQPAYVDGVLFFGSEDGTVYALDANKGCIYWTYAAGVEVRTGISVIADQPKLGIALVFGDFMGRIHALDAATGKMLWKARPETHATATVTAQPQYHNGVIYVSMSSREFLAGASPDYDCCTFRGSVIALDAVRGEPLWQRYVISDAPQKVGERSSGTTIFAPSGAPVWNTATIDAKRKQLYVGTGENYSRPASDTSDAIIAIDLDSGAINWVRQTLADDAWNIACTGRIPDKSNCPEPGGPDLDFGAPPILVATPAGDILIAGQKSGWVFGISPDDGDIVWNRRVGRGGGQGGVHFGMAASNGVVFAPVFDPTGVFGPDDDFPPQPGLHALDAASGEVLWSTIADDRCAGRPFCAPGISAPPTALDGIVLAGHSDGRLRAYNAQTGAVIWSVETDRDFDTLNHLPGAGGSMGGGSGPLVVNGVVYVNSGYSSLRHMPGNVLLAFRISDHAGIQE